MGLYFDGHEREDMVEYHEIYIPKSRYTPFYPLISAYLFHWQNYRDT